MVSDPDPDSREDLDEGLSDLARAYRSVGPYLHIGWSLAASVVVGTLGGWWLDGKLGTEPWLLIIGALLGITAGFVELFRTVAKL